MKVEDPVCNMTIEDKDAAASSIYKGITYFFCSIPCKENFDKNPESFLEVRSQKSEAKKRKERWQKTLCAEWLSRRNAL